MDARLAPVIERADAAFGEAVRQVGEFVDYAAVSYGGAEGAHAGRVRELAAAVVRHLGNLPAAQRPSRCLLHELPDALPLVTAEWDAGGALPTLLVYGHGDVQPANAEEWHSPPFEAVVRRDDSGSERLYGRGTSDDIGGWYSHVAAIRAWLASRGRLPLNVRLMIEFEEEIGSPNLMRYVDHLGDFVEVDAMVLTDCENPSVDVPGLTVSLRGLAEADLVCRTGHGDGHSGLFGGVWSDPSLALVRIANRLLDADGRAAFARQELGRDERRALASVDPELDFDPAAALPDRGRAKAEWVWRQPAITITGTSLPDVASENNESKPTNSVRGEARLRLSIRVPPGATADAVLDEVEAIVADSPPPGIQVSLERRHAGDGGAWRYDVPDCIAFEAANRAYATVWGTPPLRVGVGGSIPFVQQFAARFGATTPLILNGVLDPASALHAPNESLHLGVFRKAIHTNIHLLDEFGKLARGRFMDPPSG